MVFHIIIRYKPIGYNFIIHMEKSYLHRLIDRELYCNEHYLSVRMANSREEYL